MSYVDLSSHLDKILESDGKTKEAVDIRLTIGRYNDLHGFRHPTGEVLLCSAQVNQFATHVRMERDDQNRIMVFPYIEDLGVKVYSSPTAFYVGFDNPSGFGIVPYSDWDHHFGLAQIAPEILAKIVDFLAVHPPIDYM